MHQHSQRYLSIHKSQNPSTNIYIGLSIYFQISGYKRESLQKYLLRSKSQSQTLNILNYTLSSFPDLKSWPTNSSLVIFRQDDGSARIRCSRFASHEGVDGVGIGAHALVDCRREEVGEQPRQRRWTSRSLRAGRRPPSLPEETVPQRGRPRSSV